jgi:hypothetical protein
MTRLATLNEPPDLLKEGCLSILKDLKAAKEVF